MKKLINGFVVAVGLLLTANVANAQQKLGHVNSDEIFATWGEAKTAQTSLENLGKTKQAEIDQMIKEYQTKANAAQEKQRNLSEANKDVVGKELQTAALELQELEKRINDARTKAGNDLQAKEAELINPLRTKVGNAINSVAKEKALAYVFDISGQAGSGVVYADGGEDITAAVKTKLGISATAAPAAAKPAAAPAKKP